MLLQDIKVRSDNARPTTPDTIKVSGAVWKKSAISQQAWSLRLAQEYKRSVMTVFVTLTFDDKHLKYFHYSPYVKWDVKCFDNLGFREDLIRRLRKIDGYVFKYVAFPEYGSDREYYDEHGKLRRATMRPHYHVLFFFPYEIDVPCFKRRVAELWNRCIEKSLDVVPVTEDKGFTRYVSKYVSKGFDEKLPSTLLDRVKHYRTEIKNIDSVPRETMNYRKFDYYYMADFLAWYENCRPKILCSKGIGNVDYSDKELLKGSTLLFNGKKFENTPLSPYVKRKHYFDRSKSIIKHSYKRKGAKLDIFDELHDFVNYDWSLNDFGREALIQQLPTKIHSCRDWFVRAMSLKGTIPHEAVEFYNHNSIFKLEYGSTYEELYNVMNEFDISVDVLVSWKLFYSRYDVNRLSELLDVDLINLSTEELVDNWQSFYVCLVNSSSEKKYYGSNRKKDNIFLNDFVHVYYLANVICETFSIAVEITQYVAYLKRKREREEKKNLKYTRFDTNKIY